MGGDPQPPRPISPASPSRRERRSLFNHPKPSRTKMEERWMTEDEYLTKQFEIKAEIPDKLETRRACPLGLWMMPPRGWEVEPGELEFIRHQMHAERVDLDGEVDEEKEKVAVESYETFLKQYTDWVEAYQDQLEEESFKRESGRVPLPRKRPPENLEKQSLLSNHPRADGLWQLHVAEQMILDEGAANPEKYKNNKFTETTDFDEENSVEYTKAYFKKALLHKTILKTNVNELDLDAARVERQLNNKLKKEAEAREREFKVENLRRSIEMDEYDPMHWRRSLEEKRSFNQRYQLEPGRSDVDTAFSKGHYDPTNPLHRYDYWGEPKNSEKSRQESD